MNRLLIQKLWSLGVFLLLIPIFAVHSVNQSNAASLSDSTPTPSPTTPEDLDGKPPFEGGRPVDIPAVPPTNNEQDVLPKAALTFPVIDVWYDGEYEVGQNGDPQQWVNILGNVSGVPVVKTALSYRLNNTGGFKPLSIGPDNRRLGAAGDFNIELDINDLIDGVNVVRIRAEHTDSGDTTMTDVTFTYHAGNSPNENYSIDWSTAADIHEVAQIVDGQWTINGNNTISPNNLDSGAPELFYDRLVALGDMGWKDYEVTVPVTIHGFDPNGYNSPSNGPGVGIILRWRGQFQQNNEQPRTGWQEIGGLGWFRWSGTSTNPEVGLQMIGWSRNDPEDNDDNYPGGGNILDTNSSVTYQPNVEYIMKMQVESTTNGDVYRFKVWRANQAEPEAWDMEGIVDDPDRHPTGSAVLVSHHVDVSFGNVTVRSLTEVEEESYSLLLPAVFR